MASHPTLEQWEEWVMSESDYRPGDGIVHFDHGCVNPWAVYEIIGGKVVEVFRAIGPSCRPCINWMQGQTRLRWNEYDHEWLGWLGVEPYASQNERR